MCCFLSVDSSEKAKIKFSACSTLKLFAKNGNFITMSIISTKANNLTPPFDSYQKIMYKKEKFKRKLKHVRYKLPGKVTMWRFSADVMQASSMKAEPTQSPPTKNLKEIKNVILKTNLELREHASNGPL